MAGTARTASHWLLQAGVSLTCLAAASAPSMAHAQEAQAGQPSTDEDIVVTARRREESLIDVPISVSTQSAEQLDQRGATDITALQRTTPNLTLQVSRGTNSTITAFIRGVGQQDPLWGFEPGVGLYIDDVYVARPQGAILDIFDIQRIEVLRGPQGTLYGRNTIGGAIKYVTATLSADPSFNARTNIGDYNQHDVILAGSVPLSDSLRVGAAFADYQRDGFGTNHFTGADTNNRDAMAGRLTLEFTPTANLFFRLSADRLDDDSNTNNGHRELPVPALFAGAPFNVPAAALPVQHNVYDTWSGLGDDNEVITQGVSLLGQWEASDALTFKSITAYRDGQTNSNGIDFDGTPAPILDISARGSVYSDHQFSQEFQALVNQPHWNGVVGVYYLDASASGNYDTILGAANLTQGTSGNVDTRSYAVFGDFDFSLGDRWRLELGGRWTRDEKEGTVFKANYLGLGSPISGRAVSPFQILTNYTNARAFEEFTPHVSLTYALADHVNLYASYGRGFKSGGFDMRGDATATPATVNGYDPEVVDSYELGFKGLFFDDRLRLSAAVFHSAYDGQQITSQQVNAAGTGVVSFVDNVGSSRIDGAELEMHARLSEAFSIDFDLGYIDAAFQSYLAYVPNPSPPPAFIQQDVSSQRQFQNTPRWNGSIAANYRFDLHGAGDLNIRGAMSFRSDTSMFETPVPAIDQAAYQLYDLSAVWTSQSQHWRLGVYGRNLGDERYRTGGYNFPGTLYGDSVIAFYGPPRTVFASLAYRY